MKILITGVTGQVAMPIALALAGDNEVWGVARFRDADAKARLEAGGVHCDAHDLVQGDLAGLPDDFTHVLHFAVGKHPSFDKSIAANAEATGLLMAHCRSAQAFLYCSSTAVYQPNDHHVFAETDPLGDHHRNLFPSYSITKIAGEAVARTCARIYDLPTVIARLNVPYGDNGGWPAFHLEMILGGHPIAVHPNRPSIYNPIHQDDIVAQVPALLAAASVPARIVNWAGPETVSIEDWCTYLGDMVAREPVFEDDPRALESVACDTTVLREIAPPTTVGWRDGLRRMVATMHPELLV
jgi:nucleoside-diphosphate-sugar epimerase